MKVIYVIKFCGYKSMYCDNLQLVKDFLKKYGSTEQEIETMLNGVAGVNDFDDYIRIVKIELNKEIEKWL